MNPKKLNNAFKRKKIAEFSGKTGSVGLTLGNWINHDTAAQ